MSRKRDRRKLLAVVMSGGTTPLLLGSGIQFSFEAGETWSQSQATMILDNEHVTNGLQSMKLTTSNAVRSAGDGSYSLPNINSVITVDMYIDDITKLGQIQFMFTKNNWTGWIQFFGTPAWMVGLKSGWNRIYIAPHECSFGGTGAFSDWPSVNTIRITATSVAGQTCNVWVDRFYWYRCKPAITFTFDDGRKAVYDYAFPILRDYGWNGVSYVTTDAVGQNTYSSAGGGGAYSPMTLAEIQQMHGAGWDISSHTMTHPDLTSLDITGQEAEIQGAYNWLNANGFSRGSRFFAPPYGKRDANTVTVAKKYHQTLRDASGLGNIGGFNNLPLIWRATDTQYGLCYWEIAANDLTTLTLFQDLVDKTLAYGLWTVLVFHEVGPSGWCSEALFRSYCDYIKLKGVDVLTMSQYWDRRSNVASQFVMNGS